jgi:hypothetical protein
VNAEVNRSRCAIDRKKISVIVIPYQMGAEVGGVRYSLFGIARYQAQGVSVYRNPDESETGWYTTTHGRRLLSKVQCVGLEKEG